MTEIPTGTIRPVITGSTGAIGLGPYGDEPEHNGPPEVILRPDIFRPFFATDARSMLITVLPNHYNLIPNPSFRTDMSGWETASTNLLSADQAFSDSAHMWSDSQQGPAAGTSEQSTEWAAYGTNSTKFTSLSPSAVSWDQKGSTSPVTGGNVYTIAGTFHRTAAFARILTLQIVWFNDALSVVGSNNHGFSGDSWVGDTYEVNVSLTAPDTARSARIYMRAEGGTGAVGGETWWVDKLGVWAGAGGEWIRPVTFALASDSWVGQSVQCTGTGNLRYRAGPDKFVYVGNPAGLFPEQMDYRRGGGEYTFSVYAKGSGKVRLSMDAYFPEDLEDPISGPEFQNLRTESDPGGLGGVNLFSDKQASGGDTGDWINGIDFSTTGGLVGNVVTSGDSAYTGSKSLKVTFPDDVVQYINIFPYYNTPQALPLPVGGSRVVTASCRARVATGTCAMAIVLIWANAQGGYVGETISAYTTLTSEWQELSYSVEPPPTAVAFSSRIYSGNGAHSVGAVAYLDSFGTWHGAGGEWTDSGENAVIEAGTGRVWARRDPAPKAAPFFEDLDRPPAFESVEGSSVTIEEDDNWHRVAITTRARVQEGNGRINFSGAHWIDTRIYVENADDLLISSAMLDTTEYPEAAFFDGGLTESIHEDDFIWEGPVDNSVSCYYYDRLVRTQWLDKYLPNVVPAGRPYQIFFGSYWRPYVSDTGETIMMPLP